MVTYEPGETEEDEAERQFLEANEVLESAATHANSLIGLPRDISLTALSCGEENAFWDPESETIAFCYELACAYRSLFTDLNTEGSEAERVRATDDDVIGISNSVVFHEFGHALISLYDLPITGREEDAADQLATLLLAGDSLHQEYAVSAIEAWGALALSAEQGDVAADPADEHSLDSQRYFNAICWLYGSDPAAYQGVVATDGNPDGVLPEDRAARCPAEFDQIDQAWGTLLEPYLKTA
ncbi:DUF4344 domain-containing metallopeptidase [Streptomyces roseicoloratus]|uniref:DUF4344 domain-containing metallopeptidase n=1 Tax=Streptomyces roseicoloratus TaxID=2508722 RepID=A0ABY9RZI4_9ACTN|nr:DUF4344 domain-containing metallopeptidase [Streptomyces roseicoloratus]WMX47402.1 DUF4344 domain-containing metallopeptidase [Streptomyces roseicoloratus]